ncbi:hypothetical protein BA895_12100 [Humibacillus sp. DSM 29435]|uniref:STAS domain-containing protein n=1 Tax=Humibacillus sp. DSM 29435 TaxID=1869167 RepID=UPI000871D6D7|nr:STAS domain-containing protein [Humibacillus sp. DSM 29435]OFE18369.1 hypothetical protein BA895_12100 [Humibacillus sp. DSM 29435]
MKVCGDLTEADTRHLATMLNAMAWSDGQRATIDLADVSSVGSELLRVLRTARTRSRGRLTVTADRPEVRFPLALVGMVSLGDMDWLEHQDRSDGQSEKVGDASFRA